jgi:hypothetical protein
MKALMSSIPTPPHDAFWSNYAVSEDDLDFLFNLLLEREKPLTLREMIAPLIENHLDRLEQEAKVAAEAEHPLYLPKESYEVGQVLVFPAFEGAVGEVVSKRPGENPDLGPFDVIEVEFENGRGKHAFACQLEDHKLNQAPDQEELDEDLDPVDLVIDQYGRRYEAELADLLESNDDIVRIAWRWFPRSLLANINPGHLNLAEAVLDVASGGPLPTEAILKEVELPKDLDPILLRFSMDYALQEDERFDEVGPAGEIQWFLKRLEPPEVLYRPPRLAYQERDFDRDKLTEPLLDLEARLEDEYSPGVPGDEPVTALTVPLLFPHWRVGALPLSTRLGQLFPTAYEAPRIRFVLVDGHSQDRFPGWVVREHGYVYGLDGWYRKYDVPAGGLVQLRLGENEGEVVVETVDRRQRNDWIRTVSIAEDGRIGFTMLKQPVGTSYDELMVVGLVNPEALDEAWLSGSQRGMSDEKLIAYVFRELAKLNPQSAVHAKSLYSGVNVLRRLPPGPIFSELVTRPYYEHVGDLYWRLDDTPRSEA